jgi:predicted metal-dependent hydrolase
VNEACREAWRRGARLFDEGEYWECHEALEPAWLTAAGTEKRFLGGVILLAAALHKARRMGSARGGRRNYAKALAKLALVGDRFFGVDVRELEARVHVALRRPDARPAMPYLESEEDAVDGT